MNKHRWRKLLAYTGAIAIVVLIGLGTYVFVIRANDGADGYTRNLHHAATELHSNLNKLANSTQLAVFNDPDRTPSQNIKDLDNALAIIENTRTQIADFAKQADDLPLLPHISFLSSYQDAKVDQQHAQDIVAQTNDALSQYQNLIGFLEQYYGLDNTFVSLSAKVNNVSNLDALIPLSSQIFADSQTLSQLAVAADRLIAPAGYEGLTTKASTIYSQAANGFKILAQGLSNNSDTGKDSGIRLVEQAVIQHENTLVDLPSNMAQKSYVLAQVTDLPDKTDSIIAASANGD